MISLKKDAILITDAYTYKETEVATGIAQLRKDNPDNEGLAKRSDKSYINEWAVHALCYRWCIMKARAKDAKLQFDMEPEVSFLYNVLGPAARFVLRFYH